MPIPKKESDRQPKTAKELVYTKMREWIINGTLQPEEKISDQEIAQYFSVSRTPVREAIQMLADQKLVNIYPGRETRVSPLNMDEAIYTYGMMAELHVLALEFSYPKITRETIAELRKTDQSFYAAAEKHNVEEAAAYDQRFHGTFIQLSDHYFLAEFTHILASHIQRIENLYYMQHASVSFESHEGIIAALEEHDLPKAKEAMRNNWIHTLEKVGNV